MTIHEILSALEPHKKLSREGLYIHLRAAKIKPLGGPRSQTPAQYPADAPQRILKRLGLLTTRNGSRKARR